MVIAGGFHEIVLHAGAVLGLRPEPVLIAGLSIAAIVNYLLTGGLFMHLISVKRDLPFVASDWLGSTSWMGALQVGSAVAVGLAVLVTQLFGVVTLIVRAGRGGHDGRAHPHERDAQRGRALENEAQIAEARREAEVNYQRFMASFTHAAVGMAITQPGGTTLRVNQAVCQLLRPRRGRAGRRALRRLLQAEDLAPTARRCRRC
jgi:PAS domain-containing protein